MAQLILRDSYAGVAVVRSVLAVLAVLSPIANAQIPTEGGRCPIKNPTTPIDIKKIAGQWYEIEGTPNFLEDAYKCISIKIPSFYEKKTEITVDAVDRVSKKSSTVSKLSAKIPESSDEKDGKIILTMIPTPTSPEGEPFYGPHLRSLYTKLPMRILATDYNNWALVWMCKNHKAAAHTEFLWILSRERTLTEDKYPAIREAMETHNLAGISTKQTVQFGCSKEEEHDMKKDDEELIQ